MTPDESNLLCYLAIQVVKIIARDLGKRALKRTFGNRAFADRDMRHLQRLCGYIWKVDRKMGELALKVVMQNGPGAQEQEMLRAVRATLGKDFFDKEYPDLKVKVVDKPGKVTIVQEDTDGKNEEDEDQTAKQEQLPG